MVSSVTRISPVIVQFCSLHLALRGEEAELEGAGLVEGDGQVRLEKERLCSLTSAPI